MKPNQPKNQQPDDTTPNTSNDADPKDNVYSKEAVSKVVDRLSKLGGLEDPNKTWSPPQNEKPKPELDLTLTEDDEDYSTQPIPTDWVAPVEYTKGEPPELVDSQSKPKKAEKITSVSSNIVQTTEIPLAQVTSSPPWTLQQFFNGEIDLDVELSRRFPSMPMMSIIKTRSLGTNTGRKVAELSSQDGAATMVIDADTVSKVIQLSFTVGSMLTLKFAMNELSNMDRDRWLELMRRDAGGLAFLWGTKRWASDYLICISRKHFTNLYAFSPNNFEAGVRLTPTVTKDILDWLEKIWDEPEEDDEPPQLLTW